jgi:septal ring factor EnvC (AmiA/AmiB activator)
MGARQMQLGAGEFAAPIIEQIKQMAADGKALLENPKVEGQRKPSEAVVREVGYRIENLSRMQHALKSGFVDDPTYKPTDDPDDAGIREDIEPEITGAREEILDELGRLHGAMTALSEERQALQSQMAAMLNQQRDEEKKMMYVFRHKLAEELRRGEADLQNRLGRLVNSMRSPNWFVDQRKKIEEDRARAAEERANHEKAMEDGLPPEIHSGDITASREFRPRTEHGPAVVESQEHQRPLPLSAEESLTGMSIRRPKDTLQEEFIENTERALAESGGGGGTCCIQSSSAIA